MRLHPQVLQIGTDWGENGHTKLYFLDGERRAIIDTGVRGSPARDIGPYLDYFGFKLSDIDLILNTHGHQDHVGGNPELSEAEIWLHQADVFLVSDLPQAFESRYGAAMRRMGRAEDRIKEEKNRFIARCVKQEVAHVLEDGETVNLGKGIELTVVALPGHSKGSIGYYWEKEGMLFAGDAAMGQGSRPGILPTLYHPLEYTRTLDKLMSMEIGLLGLGHFYQAVRTNSNSIKKGKQITAYLQDCKDIHNRLFEAVAKSVYRYSGAPFPAVALAAIDDLSSQLFLRRDPMTAMPPDAARTLLAYYDTITTM